MTNILTVFLAACAILGVLAAAFLIVGFLKTRRLAAWSEKQVPQAGDVQAVSGGALHFVELGPRDAQPIVLIHGLGGQVQHFTYAVTDLLKRKHRLIVIDRPGCGYSSRDSADLAGLSQQATMIWRFLDARAVVNPVLVGHSLGGAIALAMAVQRPDQTGALALLAPLTHPVAAPTPPLAERALANPFWRRLLSVTWAVPNLKSTADATLTQFFAPDPWPDDFLYKAGGALGLRPNAFRVSVEDSLAARRDIETLSQRYGALTKPRGVLFGSADAIVSPDAHGRSMERFGLTYQELPDRGHMLPITAPGECAAFIQDIAARASDRR